LQNERYMAITAKDVQNLRAKTGIGMMECKKALTEANGNEEEAIKILREKGLAVAAKKASRIAAEGVVDILHCKECNTAVMLEVNIETDFAAKNEMFANFVKDLMKIILDKKPANVEELMKLPFNNELDVEAALKEKIFTIGENINIRRFTIVEGVLSTYVHGKGSIGVIVKLKDGCGTSDLVYEAAKNVALQVAAMNPAYLNKEDVPQSIVDNEKAIITAQIENDEANSKKPANIIEKMVTGRIGKYFDNNCLMLQGYVKDDSVNVAGYLKQVSAQVGATVDVDSFVRFEKGEGLEKKEEDFAAEIEKLAKI